MGSKYEVSAFKYPYQGTERYKQTNWLIIAILYTTIWSMNYDGVDLRKRI